MKFDIYAEIFADIMGFVADLYAKIMDFVSGFDKEWGFEK